MKALYCNRECRLAAQGRLGAARAEALKAATGSSAGSDPTGSSAGVIQPEEEEAPR